MRLANRLLGALLALAVMAGGVVLIVEVIASAAGHRPALVPWHTAYDWARRTTWTASGVRVACGVLIALGLILLIAELKPARMTRLVAEPADAGAADIDTAYTRRGLAAAIRSAAVGVDGVRGASVSVRRRKVSVAATALARDRAAARGLQEPVTAAVGERLAALRLRRAPSVSVHVRPGSR